MIVIGKAIAPAAAITLNAELMLGVDGLIKCVINSSELAENDIQTPLLQANIKEVNISEPLGSIPRSVSFINGWVFVVDDNSKINQWLKQQNKSAWLHQLERNAVAIIISLIVSGLLGWGLISQGIPTVSRALAQIVPISIKESVAEYTLEYLDEGLLTPSQLSIERQIQLKQLLSDTLLNHSAAKNSQLIFRSYPLAANAFTLSDSTIILTDEIVAISANDREIQAVLLHEIGHQIHDHLMTQMVESTLLSVLASYVIGDAVGLADTLASASIFAATMQYSQTAELKADQFAAMQLVKQYGNAEDLVAILSKLHVASGTDLLSTHPNMDARIAAINTVTLP